MEVHTLEGFFFSFLASIIFLDSAFSIFGYESCDSFLTGMSSSIYSIISCIRLSLSLSFLPFLRTYLILASFSIKY